MLSETLPQTPCLNRPFVQQLYHSCRCRDLTYSCFLGARNVTKSKWFPWITISLLLLLITIGNSKSIWNYLPKKKPPREAKKNEAFTIKNLSKCGDATAQLIDDNLVQIVGGTEEEQATCVKWVQENHPEYEIT